MSRIDEWGNRPELKSGAVFNFDENVDAVRISAEWINQDRLSLICDLDLVIYYYDDRARLIERINFGKPLSDDLSISFSGDGADSRQATSSHMEYVNIYLSRSRKDASSILICLDGDPRNFSFVQTVICRCTKAPSSTLAGSFINRSQDEQSSRIFYSSCRIKKDCKGIILCTLYKDRWINGVPTWAAKVSMELITTTLVNAREKEEKFNSSIIHSVPSLERFRPYIFNNVRTICAALSSQALPKLKLKFQRDFGLKIDQFVEVIFKQLSETHPMVLEEREAEYTIAMLEEMFQQIDFNGDGDCTWDEFTSFAIQTGLSVTQTRDLLGGRDNLNEYIIEYAEDILLRDNVLSEFRQILGFKHVPQEKRILITLNDSDDVLVFNEKFDLLSRIEPCNLKVLPGITLLEPDDPTLVHLTGSKIIIHDIIYIPDRALYVYCASDHTIVMCREHITMGGMRTTYSIHNKLYHNLIHTKLCYSEKSQVLCSIASGRVIYGWEIDGTIPIFHLARHSDFVTDFVCVDELGVFITCALDKRIVMWSTSSRRVKGVMVREFSLFIAYNSL